MDLEKNVETLDSHVHSLSNADMIGTITTCFANLMLTKEYVNLYFRFFHA